MSCSSAHLHIKSKTLNKYVTYLHQVWLYAYAQMRLFFFEVKKTWKTVEHQSAICHIMAVFSTSFLEFESIKSAFVVQHRATFFKLFPFVSMEESKSYRFDMKVSKLILLWKSSKNLNVTVPEEMCKHELAGICIIRLCVDILWGTNLDSMSKSWGNGQTHKALPFILV